MGAAVSVGPDGMKRRQRLLTIAGVWVFIAVIEAFVAMTR